MAMFANWGFQNFCLIFLMRQGCFFSTPSSIGMSGIRILYSRTPWLSSVSTAEECFYFRSKELPNWCLSIFQITTETVSERLKGRWHALAGHLEAAEWICALNYNGTPCFLGGLWKWGERFANGWEAKIQRWDEPLVRYLLLNNDHLGCVVSIAYIATPTLGLLLGYSGELFVCAL